MFYFFKQKTAYGLRISDWSSDVCSSDLLPRQPRRQGRPHRQPDQVLRNAGGISIRAAARRPGQRRGARGTARHRPRGARPPARRSEEHTSELQSLMRISYAVFCLKTKNKPPNILMTTV